ncbi:unnamed protein product [Nesidiocoris tenuis]|uniref:X-box-binding protein 1 n=1 Tax=Nesidiocoris tenuis TaxID=355587 RepID=A0A6H5GH63_9HEMI|nr:unnamed protein product [Nesidiocoris tenuis]
MVVTKFCRPRLLIKQEKDQIREMMIASAKNYTYTISLAAEDMDIKLEPEAAVAPPRKRRRLDYLSPEEKARRKKLKNREAAQTSRDKKKAYVTRLEETIKALRDECRPTIRTSSPTAKRSCARTTTLKSSQRTTPCPVRPLCSLPEVRQLLSTTTPTISKPIQRQNPISVTIRSTPQTATTI